MAIEEIETRNVSKELVFETAIIKIKAKKFNLILIGLYRPPTPNTHEFFLKLDKLLLTFSTVKKKNYYYGRLQHKYSNKDEPTYVKLQNLLQENNIKILDVPPTRITHTTATSIDCCYTNLEASTLDIKVHQNHISDHNGVSCTLEEYEHRATTITKLAGTHLFKTSKGLRKSLQRGT